MSKKNKVQWVGAIAIVLSAIITGVFNWLPQQNLQKGLADNSIVVDVKGNGAQINFDNSDNFEVNKIINNLNFHSNETDEKIKVSQKLSLILNELKELKGIVKNQEISGKLDQALADIEAAETPAELIAALDKSEDIVLRRKTKQTTCDLYDSKDTIDCTNCYNGGEMALGQIGKIDDNINNNGTSLIIYYLDENETITTATTLQSEVKFSTSTNMHKYNSELFGSLDKDGRRFFFFEPNTSTKYLETKDGAGFKLIKIGSGIDFARPVFRYAIDANIRFAYRGEETHGSRNIKSCTFYYVKQKIKSLETAKAAENVKVTLNESEDLTNKHEIDGWRLHIKHHEKYPNSNIKIGVDEYIYQSAPNSFYLSSISGVGGNINQSLDAEEYLGKRIKLTASLKTDGLINTTYENKKFGAQLWAYVYHDEKPIIKAATRGIEGTTDWVEQTIIFDVPEESSKITYGLSVTGNGMSWIDKIEWEVVDKSVLLMNLKTVNRKKPINLP